MIKCISHRYILSGLLSVGVVVNSAQAWAETAVEGAASGVPAVQSQVETPDKEGRVKAGKVYILVNGSPITVREYNKELFVLMKNRYYHGKVPEGKEDAVRKELTDSMVDHVLLLQDAKKRGLKPDESKIEQAVAAADAKYSYKPGWQEQREQLLAELRGLMAEKDLKDQLEQIVRDVPSATPEEVRAYYDRHGDLFTEPEKLRLSVILLKVDPSAPLDAWMKAFDDAQRVANQIKDGADFAEMARKHSGDKTAKNGGDMGYLHRGMVPVAIQDGVDKFKVGEVSAPYKGLEGVSVFRLEDRVPPRKMEFQRVEQRARDLLMRDRRDQAWKSNLERLRSEAKIEILEKPASEKNP